MKIPKYIQDMMERAEFILSYGEPGYTIAIRKTTPYTQVSTFYANQYAIVTIYDPVMKQLEKYIPKSDK